MFSTSKLIFYTVFSSFVFLLFYSCAQIGSISGGEKDTIPPVMLYSEPAFADTGFNEDRIKITFNEYFVLNDINQEFISSPPLNEFPKIYWKKHTLILDIADTLKKPETYTFYFGNAIADLNEGNVLENFKFVFATGNVVDSFAVSGRLRNAEDLKVPENPLVVVYREHADSVPFLYKPDYLSKVDTSGNFSISNIQGGEYKVFAVQDLNGNLLLDPTEPRAFLDTLIVPQREIIVNIDSLKAGTILHDINDTTYADTLQRDTVIITEQHYTYPDNIYLYLFPEKKQKQRFAGYNRPKRGKLNLTFDVPITEKFQMRPLNFSLNDSNYILEINPENDSLLYWIKDAAVQNIDTLQLEITFQTIDSLNNYILQTDTVLAEFREKRASDAWKKEKNKDTVKTKPIEYLTINYLIKNKKLDLKQDLSFELSEPLFSYDTSKIKLFEIIDTSTIDTKEQRILQIMRISDKDIYIRLRRPIVNKLQFTLVDVPKENWYRRTQQLDSTSYYFSITDNELAATDSLTLRVDYDNRFFLGIVQDLNDTVKLALGKQKLKSKNRAKPDLIELSFLKPLRHRIQLFALDYPEKKDAFRLSQNTLKDSLKVYVRDKDLQMLDTLKLSLKSLDYVNLAGDSVFYTDTITMVYHEKKQYLCSYERFKPETITLVFNKTLWENIQFKLLDFKESGWYSVKYNAFRDTVTINIINRELKQKDSLSLVVQYRDRSRHGDVFEYSDSIVVVTKKQTELRKKQTEAKANSELNLKPQTVSIYFPVTFKFWQDSILLRVYHIATEWKPDTKYRISIDSMAFKGFLAHYNQFNQMDFATQKEDYYAVLNVNIKNIKANLFVTPADTLQTDSLVNDSLIPVSVNSENNEFLQKRIDKVLGNGQIIIQLVKTDKKEENEEVFREYILSEDTNLSIDYINPATYRLKVIFDKNANEKWDTGDYLKHIQPEKVIYFPKKFEMKEGWEMNLDWNIGRALINSLEKGD